MVDPSVCPPKAAVELADVVRRFGPQYTSQYGHRMMPSQRRALSDIAACCTRRAGGTALPLRRLPRYVLALPLLPEPGVPQMPWKPDPAVAPGASSRAVAVRLFSRRRDRALGVARCSVATRSCCTAC